MKRRTNYKVLPLPVVQKWAKKELSREQLHEGIRLVQRLRFYPADMGLDIEPCGDGIELRIKHPLIGKQGWLRAIFWIHEKSMTIYIMDLFWKSSNRISRADITRTNHRIRKLKMELTTGKKPWA